MSSTQQPETPSPDAVDLPHRSERRRHPRRRIHDVRAQIGRVVDLSLGGMMVHRTGSAQWNVGEEHRVVIEHDMVCIPLNVRVVRAEKVGFRRFVYGLEFLGLDEQSFGHLKSLLGDACDSYPGPACWLAA